MKTVEEIQGRIKSFRKVADQLEAKALKSKSAFQVDNLYNQVERYRDRIMTLEWVLDDETV